MKYASVIRMLFLALALGFAGETALFLFAGKVQDSLYRERRAAADTVELWHEFDSATVKLLLAQGNTLPLEREWLASSGRFGAALERLLQSREFRSAVDGLAADAAFDLWQQTEQRIQEVLEFSRQWNRLPAGQLHLILDYNDSFYPFLFRTVQRYQMQLERSGSLFLSIMAGLSFAVMGVSFVLGIRASSDIARVNMTLVQQIRRRTRAQELMQQAKRDAEEANRVKSEFLTKISHELRTPLNSIMGYTELLMLDRDSAEDGAPVAGVPETPAEVSATPAEVSAKPDDVPEPTAQPAVTAGGYPEKIMRESEKLLRLVHDLLDLSRIEYQNLQLEPEVFFLRESLSEWVESIAEQARLRKLRFTLRIRDDVPDRVIGDPLRVRQVLQNLMANALKFTEQGGIDLSVHCIYEADGRTMIKFLLKDTGIGIPADRQDRIFDSFTQADGSLARRYGGSGLGTAIARHLVELMGGTIGVESGEGDGSIFWFVVPFAAAEAAEEAGVAPEPAKAAPSRAGTMDPPAAPAPGSAPQGHHPDHDGDLILMAEDYRPNAEIALRFLSDAGYRVVHVESGTEALAEAKRQRFDLILMDVQMPDMDGFRTAERIRQEGNPNLGTPILALTANTRAQDEADAFASGMNGMISKPIRRQRFLDQVARWIRHASASAVADRHPAEELRGPAAATGTVPLDLTGLAEELQDEEVARMIADGFLEQVEEQLPAMHRAFSEHDLETLAREAHSIKGGALNLMAARLGTAAKDLEYAARAGDRSLVEKLFPDLEQEFGTVRDYVRGMDGGKKWNGAPSVGKGP